MEFITTFKAIVATLSATILAFLGAAGPTSQVVGPVITTSPEVVIEQPLSTTTPEATVNVEAEVVAETQPEPLIDIYELGKAVGKLEAQAEELEKQATQTPPPASAPAPTPTPAPTPVPEPTLVEATPESMKSITIISPINGKGLGRTYTAQPQVVDETNYIELGLIVRGDDGKIVSNVEVVISALPDTDQSSTLNSTGNVKKIYDSNGVAEAVKFYPFHYEFKTAEEHTITFSVPSLELTETIKLTATEPDPA